MGELRCEAEKMYVCVCEREAEVRECEEARRAKGLEKNGLGQTRWAGGRAASFYGPTPLIGRNICHHAPPVPEAA